MGWESTAAGTGWVRVVGGIFEGGEGGGGSGRITVLKNSSSWLGDVE